MFVPISQENNITKYNDKETGITQRRLGNGMSVNYKVPLLCWVFDADENSLQF